MTDFLLLLFIFIELHDIYPTHNTCKWQLKYNPSPVTQSSIVVKKREIKLWLLLFSFGLVTFSKRIKKCYKWSLLMWKLFTMHFKIEYVKSSHNKQTFVIYIYIYIYKRKNIYPSLPSWKDMTCYQLTMKIDLKTVTLFPHFPLAVGFNHFVSTLGFNGRLLFPHFTLAEGFDLFVTTLGVLVRVLVLLFRCLKKI